MAKLPINPFASGVRSNKSSQKRNKYGARRVGEHASRKEHDRSNQLKLWQRAGVISNLREQVPYELIPASMVSAAPTSKVNRSASALRKPASTLPTLSIPTPQLGRP